MVLNIQRCFTVHKAACTPRQRARTSTTSLLKAPLRPFRKQQHSQQSLPVNQPKARLQTTFHFQSGVHRTKTLLAVRILVLPVQATFPPPTEIPSTSLSTQPTFNPAPLFFLTPLLYPTALNLFHTTSLFLHKAPQ